MRAERGDDYGWTASRRERDRENGPIRGEGESAPRRKRVAAARGTGERGRRRRRETERTNERE